MARRYRGQTGVMAVDRSRDSLGRQGLVRPRRGKLIAGVCAGIARRYGFTPSGVRLVFVASLLLPGPQVLAYLALWVLMPREPRQT